MKNRGAPANLINLPSNPSLQGLEALAKHPLSCHPQRGVFGCLESERKRREKRANEGRKQGPVMENAFDES